MNRLFCLLILLLSSTLVQAQIREGLVKYNMTVEGDESGMANPLLGNSAVNVYFRQDKTVMEMASPIYNMKTISDSKNVLILMDAMGQKSFTRSSKAEADKQKSKSGTSGPKIEFTKEKKKILGYDCTKALATLAGKGGRSTGLIIWYTDKIQGGAGLGIINADVVSKLPGMVLEVTMTQGNLRSTLKATDISTKPIPEAIFNPSTSGYTERKR